MNIEDILNNSTYDENKLIDYGFIRDNENYIYNKHIINNSFLIIITINKTIDVKIIDLNFNEEYTNHKIDTMNGEFVNKIRDEYNNILIDIKNKCYKENNFIFNQTNRINDYIKSKLKIEPEFPWDKTPQDATYKNKKNKKWFAIIMNINMNKIDNKEDKNIEIINLKLDPIIINGLLKEEGYYPAYHMNKKNWITIILNDKVKDEIIFYLINESYKNTNK